MATSMNNTSRRPAGRRHRAALVLVLVLIVVMMLALAGFTFAELMFTEAKATRLHGDQLRLQQAIHSGVAQLNLFLEQPRAAQEAAGGTFSNPAMFQAVPLEPEFPGTTTLVNQLRFSVVTPAMETSEATDPRGVRFGVENESGRLHLADVLRYDQEMAGAGCQTLLKLPGMTEEVADAIMDWLDPDSEPRPMGAEDDYYGGLPEPYAPRNGLPDCIEELLLIKGVTRELLFGADANYNRILEPGELAASASTSRPQSSAQIVPWSWLLTLYSGQRNRDSQGQPRINLNGPDMAVLHRRLTEAVGPEIASFAVAYRQSGEDVTGGAPMAGPIPFNPQFAPTHPVRSVLDLVDAKVAIQDSPSGSKRTIYQSPLQVGTPSFEKQLAVLMDIATTNPEPVRRGGVSVNDAPAVILQTVPGIDESLAQQIISARQNPAPGGEASRRHPTWLLTEGVVDLQTMKRLLPNLTGSGDVVRAQIVAHQDQPQLSARTEVVIDASGGAARTVLWRDLRFYGTGYPTEWLTAGAPQGPRN